jgi:hypothetical protein
MADKKIFSIAHFENSANSLHDDTYYQLIKNSSQEFKDEIHDIYFGKNFRYKYDGRDKTYGNPMGVEATDAQVDNLFRIQNEFGIDISLTINSIETPKELFFDAKVVQEFIAFLKSFYDRGLRSCTLASPHIIRSGELHDLFPEMRWKNTVNHRVADAQQVLDYAFCGYDTIVLDRSLCRNLNELTKIRKAVDYYNRTYKPSKKILTSLLAVEGCLYNCPFKREHDSMGEYIGGQYFKSTSKLTCNNWRYNFPYSRLPRNGIDLIVSDKETFYEIAKLTDIFKFSGRYTSFKFQPGDIGNRKAGWDFTTTLIDKFNNPLDKVVFSDNITDAINDNILPLNSWRFGYGDPGKDGNHYKNELDMLNTMPNFWRTANGKRLVKILENCRSQCWECHECEKSINTPYFDSALQLRFKPSE